MTVRTASTQPAEVTATQMRSREALAGQWLRARSHHPRTTIPGPLSTVARGSQGVDSIAISEAQVADAARSAIANVALGGRGAELPAFKVQGMEKWDGRILAVEDGIFSAELEPHEPENQVVTADFSLDLLAPDTDVRPGDLIYVTARTVVQRPGYPPSRTVSVRLRRTGNWTSAEADAIRDRAAESKQRYDSLFD